MPPFPKPRFDYSPRVARELGALRALRDERGIPAKRDDRLLLATWNIANLGAQERSDADHELIAEIVGWFDLVAVQEVGDNLSGIRAVRDQLPPSWRMQFSEAGGNRERAAFIYDASKVEPLEKTGRLAIPPSELARIRLNGVREQFRGFDRGPYVGTFRAGRFSIELVNVHLFFGSDSERADIESRSATSTCPSCLTTIRSTAHSRRAGSSYLPTRAPWEGRASKVTSTTIRSPSSRERRASSPSASTCSTSTTRSSRTCISRAP